MNSKFIQYLDIEFNLSAGTVSPIYEAQHYVEICEYKFQSHGNCN